MATVWNRFCVPDIDVKPAPVQFTEKIDENLKCRDCFRMGTSSCEETPKGHPDVCICKEGWSTQRCWRFPKFCPNTTCQKESHCEERVTHSVCVCDTEACVVESRRLNRSFEMVILDAATIYGGPSLEMIMRLILTATFPQRGNTIQDSLQYARANAMTCAGFVFILGRYLSIDIAGRRIFSLFFHIPQLLIHVFFVVEIIHIDSVMRGRSTNEWATSTSQFMRKTRWDYGRTFPPTIILALVYTIGNWHFNWTTHQTEYSFIGIFDIDNFGIVGWAFLAYAVSAYYCLSHGFSILMDKNRRFFESTKRDNKFETSTDPEKQELEDMCWRNLPSVIIGAPIQFLYSSTLMSTLVWDYKELKYTNLLFLVMNTCARVFQSLQCERKYLGWIRSWKMARKPLEEQYNEYTYQNTSEIIAQKGPVKYSEMLEKRRVAEEEKKEATERKIDELKQEFLAKGIPLGFLPHIYLEGPETCKNFEYDLFHRHYLTTRQREWYFTRWTQVYLEARIFIGISVEDACQHVENGLKDNGFMDGDYCPSIQANTMWAEFVDMMEYQDRLDFVRPTHTEYRFVKNILKKWGNDKDGLDVENRINEGVMDPKKRKLLEPLMELFSYSCPDEEETGPGCYRDHFGFLWNTTVRKDLPVITRAQEERTWNSIQTDLKRENFWNDFVFSDDTKFNEIEGAAYADELKKIYGVKDAYPEGKKARTRNPRKHEVDLCYFAQSRPDFIGPKQPQFHLPGGPLLRRHWLEETYRPIRDGVFNRMSEQFGARQMNAVVRTVTKRNRRRR